MVSSFHTLTLLCALLLPGTTCGRDGQSRASLGAPTVPVPVAAKLPHRVDRWKSAEALLRGEPPVGSGGSSGREGIVVPGSLVRNSMVDIVGACPAADGVGEHDEQLNALESAAFRMIAAGMQRPFQMERRWCFSSWRRKNGAPNSRGRRYHFAPWVKHTVALLDLWEALQVTPCPGRTGKLRGLLMAALEESRRKAGAAKNRRETAGEGPPPDLSWWEGPWIVALADAFSCGFDEELDAHPPPPGTLPADAASGRFAGDRTLQQVWRLSKGYLRGPQKMREKPLRQHDFDLSLYVPFLVGGGHVDAKYGRYMRDGKLRGGWPTYGGPACWFVFHSLAARLGEIRDTCGPHHDHRQHLHDEVATAANATAAGVTALAAAAAAGAGGRGKAVGAGGAGGGSGSFGGGGGGDPLVELFKTMLLFFMVNHPCPFCKEHLLSRLTRNDDSWPRLSGVGITFPEASLYPLEWLFVGGAAGVTTAAKFEAVKDARGLGLFLWKLHNAVTSTTEHGEGCRTEELYDDDVLFRCTDDADGQRPRMGRAWPFARRFQYWIKGGPAAWQAARTHPGVRTALQRLHDLDGPDVRVNYWTGLTTPPPSSKQAGSTALAAAQDKVVEAVSALDVAMLDMGLLHDQYGLTHLPPVCSRLARGGHDAAAPAAAAPCLDSLPVPEAPSPLGADGNFPFLPDECAAEMGKDDDG